MMSYSSVARTPPPVDRRTTRRLMLAAAVALVLTAMPAAPNGTSPNSTLPREQSPASLPGGCLGLDRTTEKPSCLGQVGR